ncbi:hypothetical protein [Nocardia sp. NPDC050435]|uniref:hypothetical protein n=1 Tax=Nocardia sp. NPDC050435 TaxID=3155040 RepID=UPI003409B8EF
MTAQTEADAVVRWVERLTAAAERGELLDLADGLAADSPAREPADGDEWGLTRQIPAASLRAVLTNRDLVVDPHGIRINGARIIGPVDLESITFEHAVHLTACHVECHINLTGSKLKELKLSGSHITSIDLDGATILGDLLASERFSATEGFRAVGAKIGGLLQLDSASLSNPDGVALNLDGVTIAGAFLARYGFTATGGIRILAAKIGGSLELDDASLSNSSGFALALEYTTVVGALFARGSVVIGEVRVLGAKIGGSLELNGSSLSNPDGMALNIENVTIASTLFAGLKFAATGEIHAVGAKIGGSLELDGAELSNPGSIALDLNGAAIAGSVHARDSRVIGEIRALGAKIEGSLVLRGAILSNPDGVALNLERAMITGAVLARAKFTVTGEFRALGAKINGSLELDGAELSKPDGVALNLERTTIAGALFVRNEFTATGEIRAVSAMVGGPFDLKNASLSNPDGKALNLESSNIATLRLTPVRADGTISLIQATIADLRTPPNALPPGRLVATGWQITDIHGLIRDDSRAATEWLKTDPSGGFTAQPWHALAAAYDRNGQPTDARRLRFTAARETTRHGPRSAKPLRWVYLLFAGYGYHPLLTAFWLAGVLVLGVFITDHNTEHFIPTDRAAANKSATAYATETRTPPPQPITAAESCTRYPDYPCFNPFNYALAGTIPAATGVTKADWALSSTAPTFVTLIIPILRILGWILTVILLAGVTGLLRKG